MNTSFAFIIEDDENLGAIFSRVLAMAHFESEVITNGKTALEKLASTSPDLILLDLHLPLVSGIELLQYIRNNDRLHKTPVVMITADLLKAEEIQDQADIVLIKPIRIQQLLEVANRFYLSD
jgi:DNA-binding response OmpR family regulator